MADGENTEIFEVSAWYSPGQGPRYLQLSSHLEDAIDRGALRPGSQLPPERIIAETADISRVTVRKALGRLVDNGLIDQRHGSGSFIREKTSRTQQSLATLISFTENLKSRGRVASSKNLTLYTGAPNPGEVMALGLTSGTTITRLKRLRSSDGIPIAIETSSIPSDILPDPTVVETSLYVALRNRNVAPVRALQRVSATNLTKEDAALLQMPEGGAVLLIERTGYLSTGRPIELSVGLYHPQLYDFVSELRLD